MEICLQNKNLGKVLLLTSSEALKVQNYSKEFMMIQWKKAVVEDNLSSLTFVVTSSIFFIKKKLFQIRPVFWVVMNAPQIKMSKGVWIKKCVEYEVFPYPLRHSKLSLAFHTADLGAMQYITLHENQGSRAHHVVIL